MRKREIEKIKREALRYLENARGTAKLHSLKHVKEGKDGILRHRSGRRYDDIGDDIHDLLATLKEAKPELTLADVGTDEAELERLQDKSDDLNAPYREQRERELSARRDADAFEDAT